VRRVSHAELHEAAVKLVRGAIGRGPCPERLVLLATAVVAHVVAAARLPRRATSRDGVHEAAHIERRVGRTDTRAAA